MSEKTITPSIKPEETRSTNVPVQHEAPVRALGPLDEMDRIFETLLPRGWMRPLRWDLPFWHDFPRMEMKMPSVDIIDREDVVMLRAEIPGVAKEDLEISVDEDTVTLSGKTEHEETEEKGNVYRREIRRGSFCRTVALPRDVDATQAKAQFKDGILELSLPKVAKSKRVAVKVD